MNPLKLIGPRVLAVALALFVLEACLERFGGYGQWVVQEQVRFVGWRMLPDQDRLSRELTVPERTNSYGFRDEEWLPPDEAGPVFRVAVLGNSMTYGTSVEAEKVWTHVLEERLQAELERRGDPRRAEVMNFATQGYVFEQMLRCYVANVRRLVGEVEWRCTRPGADPGLECDAPWHSEPVFESQPYWRPDVVIVPTIPHDITPMAPGADDPDYAFRTLFVRTAIYDWLSKRVINRWIPAPKQASDPKLVALQQIEKSIKQEPYEKKNEQHWRAAQERMEVLRQMVEADGGTLMLLNLPLIHGLRNPKAPTTSVYWGPWAREFGNRPDGTPRVLHWEPMGAFRRAMERLVPYLDDDNDDWGIVSNPKGGLMITPDTPYAEDSVVLLDDVGHYSVRGHRLLADQAYEALLRAKLLDRARP